MIKNILTLSIQTLNAMLAIAAILVGVILYLHSDIKSELNDIGEELREYFEKFDRSYSNT